MPTMTVDLDGFEFSSDPVGSPRFKLQDLELYFSPPPARTKISDIPLGDGAFNPGRTYRGGKKMTLTGFAYGVDELMAEELAWERIAALSPRGYPMMMTVTTARGVRKMRVWLDNGQPLVLPFTPTSARFRVPLFAPDPRKYGPEATGTVLPTGDAIDGLVFPLFAPGWLDLGAFSPTGLFYLTNTGKADSWPKFKVRGTLNSGFSITSGASTITYGASVPLGTEVALSPYIGGRASIGASDVTSNLTVSEWPLVEPGKTRAFAFNPLGSYDANALLTWLFSEAWW